MEHLTRGRVLIAGAVAANLLAAFSAPAMAQTRDPRITVTALVGREQVAIDNGDGTFTIAGAAVRLRVMRYISVLGEVTSGSGTVFDSYEGVFTTLARPGDSLAEIERLGVVLRRDRTWTAGTGGAFAIAFHTPGTQRVGLSVSLGLGGRQLDIVDTHTLIRIPDEWPAARPTGAGEVRSSRSQGGPFVGVALPVNATSRITVIPEIRWLRTLADEDFSATTLSVRAGWRF